MKILLLSAYDTASHRYWHQGLVESFPEYQWTVLTLPGRYFAWRMRGNSLSWAFEERRQLEADFDLLIATSMTDLSALRGFLPKLASIPSLVYFHENQFAYPLSDQQKHQQIFNQTLNLYTALCADHIAFNSAYNRDSFLQGVDRLLVQMPDHVPNGISQRLQERSSVIPVAIRNDCFTVSHEQGKACRAIAWSDRNKPGIGDRPLRIAWAARWEYDKGPDRLLGILEALEASQLDYRLCILGEKFRNSPKEFSIIEEKFRHRIEHMGYVKKRETYLAWLRGADIMLSTAIHEFQGISVLEGVACGCIPVVPDRLAYAEQIESTYRYDSQLNNAGLECHITVKKILQVYYGLLDKTLQSPTIIQRYQAAAVKSSYEEIIRQITEEYP